MLICCLEAVRRRSIHSFKANGQAQPILCARHGRYDRHLSGNSHLGEVSLAHDPHGQLQLHVGRHGDHGHTRYSGDATPYRQEGRCCFHIESMK